MVIWGVIANEHEFYLGGRYRNVVESCMMMVAQLCECTKRHRSVYRTFKWVKCAVGKLYPNEKKYWAPAVFQEPFSERTVNKTPNLCFLDRTSCWGRGNASTTQMNEWNNILESDPCYGERNGAGWKMLRDGGCNHIWCFQGVIWTKTW